MIRDDELPKTMANEAQAMQDKGSSPKADTIPELKVVIPLLEDSIPVLNEIYHTSPIDDAILEQQQQEIEQQANEHRSSEPSILMETETMDIEAINSQALNTDEQKKRHIIQVSWEKTERLLMNHLPPQLSAAFITLLNTQINRHKQQLMDELSLIDDDSLQKLFEQINADQGF